MFFSIKNIYVFADETNYQVNSSIEGLSENDILIEGDSLESILDRKLRASGNALISKGNQSITG